MLNQILGALIGVCFFIVPLWAYRRGLKDGLAIKQDKPIEPIKTPVQSIKKYLDTKKSKEGEKEAMQGIHNIMNYDPFKKEGEA
jgi:hypothetical protein